MKHEAFDEALTIKAVTDLLLEHASLIGETSEQFAQDVARGVDRAQDALMAEAGPDIDQLERHLQKILNGLQVQDILRQQVHVILKGLQELSGAHVPDQQNRAAWLQHCVDEIETSYVMQSQADLHARFFGQDVATQDDDDSILF